MGANLTLSMPCRVSALRCSFLTANCGFSVLSCPLKLQKNVDVASKWLCNICRIVPDAQDSQKCFVSRDTSLEADLKSLLYYFRHHTVEPEVLKRLCFVEIVYSLQNHANRCNSSALHCL